MENDMIEYSSSEFASYIKQLIPAATGAQAAQFSRYFELLTEWGAKMNLTAIKEPRAVAEKHFADSVLPIALIPDGACIIDVGTGAGFPGVPIAIMRPDVHLTLLDSLNKRITFLTALCAELGLDARCIHARAEDAGRDAQLRGRFDIATTRAVGSVAALTEYTLPLLKVGGVSLMYKGDAGNELAQAENALFILHGSAQLHVCDAPWGTRSVIAVTKTAPTPKAYPRKAGTAEKSPL